MFVKLYSTHSRILNFYQKEFLRQFQQGRVADFDRIPPVFGSPQRVQWGCAGLAQVGCELIPVSHPFEEPSNSRMWTPPPPRLQEGLRSWCYYRGVVCSIRYTGISNSSLLQAFSSLKKHSWLRKKTGHVPAIEYCTIPIHILGITAGWYHLVFILDLPPRESPHLPISSSRFPPFIDFIFLGRKRVSVQLVLGEVKPEYWEASQRVSSHAGQELCCTRYRKSRKTSIQPNTPWR